MLRWTIIFIVVEAAWIAHVLFVIFLILFIVSLVFRGGRPPTV